MCIILWYEWGGPLKFIGYSKAQINFDLEEQFKLALLFIWSDVGSVDIH